MFTVFVFCMYMWTFRIAYTKEIHYNCSRNIEIAEMTFETLKAKVIENNYYLKINKRLTTGDNNSKSYMHELHCHTFVVIIIQMCFSDTDVSILVLQGIEFNNYLYNLIFLLDKFSYLTSTSGCKQAVICHLHVWYFNLESLIESIWRMFFHGPSKSIHHLYKVEQSMHF